MLSQATSFVSFAYKLLQQQICIKRCSRFVNTTNGRRLSNSYHRVSSVMFMMSVITQSTILLCADKTLLDPVGYLLAVGRYIDTLQSDFPSAIASSPDRICPEQCEQAHPVKHETQKGFEARHSLFCSLPCSIWNIQWQHWPVKHIRSQNGFAQS